MTFSRPGLVTEPTRCSFAPTGHNVEDLEESHLATDVAVQVAPGLTATAVPVAPHLHTVQVDLPGTHRIQRCLPGRTV